MDTGPKESGMQYDTILVANSSQVCYSSAFLVGLMVGATGATITTMKFPNQANSYLGAVERIASARREKKKKTRVKGRRRSRSNWQMTPWLLKQGNSRILEHLDLIFWNCPKGGILVVVENGCR
jgi:hypothetical protein